MTSVPRANSFPGVTLGHVVNEEDVPAEFKVVAVLAKAEQVGGATSDQSR